MTGHNFLVGIIEASQEFLPLLAYSMQSLPMLREGLRVFGDGNFPGELYGSPDASDRYLTFGLYLKRPSVDPDDKGQRQIPPLDPSLSMAS